jgi:Integrase core domain
MPFHPDDGTPFFHLARTIIQQANIACTVHIEEPDRIVSHYDRISHLLQIFIQVSAENDEDRIREWIDTIIQTQNRIISYLEAIHEFDYEIAENDAAVPIALAPEFHQIPTGGRPQISLPWNTITRYRNLNYSWTAIASLLNIHPQTLNRYCIRYNFQDPKPYSTITNDELNNLVSQIIDQSSGVIGSQFMCSILQDYGIKVVRHRVRESMRRVDQLGNLERWATLIPRLVYSVRAPNSLWHMDGNLKLKDYGFVLHACIDGYSRRVIYLEVDTNNRAATVLNAFLAGVEKLNAVPSRVRADKGKENVDVATWMLIHQGVGRGSFISGRSVHNQRIERLWRDVNRWNSTFRLIFHHLRTNDYYDPDNDVDKFCLIFVYLPLLKRSLSQFVRVWNNHKIRTEHHRTPLQLYADGDSRMPSEQLTEHEVEQYGVDWEGPVPANRDDDDSVVVEPPEMLLSDEDWNMLVNQYQAQLYPTHESIENNLITPNTNYVIDMYLDIREWVEERIATYNVINN